MSMMIFLFKKRCGGVIHDNVQSAIDNINNIKVLKKELGRIFKCLTDMYVDIKIEIVELKVGYLKYKIIEIRNKTNYKNIEHKSLKLLRKEKLKSLYEFD